MNNEAKKRLRIGFAGNLEKDGIAAQRDAMMEVARAEGFRCAAYDSVAEIENDSEAPDDLVVIGGDGSLLRFATVAANRSIPILGVNQGRIGFLSEIVTEEFPDALQKLKSGAFALDTRMMLSCRVGDGRPFDCLNDIQVFKSSFSGVAEIEVTVDDLPVGTVFCDGIIAATPTGSTAYTISAGGPVVTPGLRTIVVTPICSHTLHIKPIVSAPDAIWTFHVKGTGIVAADGMQVRSVKTGDMVRVTGSEQTVSFIRFTEKNVFELIKQKLS